MIGVLDVDIWIGCEAVDNISVTDSCTSDWMLRVAGNLSSPLSWLGILKEINNFIWLSFGKQKTKFSLDY